MFSGHISIRPSVRARDKPDHLRRLRAGRRRHLYGTAHQAGLEQRLQLRICDLTNSSHAGQREGSNPVLLVQGTCTTSYGMYSVQSYNGSFTLHWNGNGNDGFQYIMQNLTHCTIQWLITVREWDRDRCTHFATGSSTARQQAFPIPCTDPCPFPAQCEYVMTPVQSVISSSRTGHPALKIMVPKQISGSPIIYC